jgi:hypothetical protein
MTLIAGIVDRWAPDFSANGLPVVYLPDGRVANGQPGNYEIEVSFTATKDPVTEKGWYSTLFGVTATGDPGLDPMEATWSQYNPLVDPNGPPPPGPQPYLYEGPPLIPPPGDCINQLQCLGATLISPSLPPSDPRNDLGTPGAPPIAGYPTLLGRFFVEWDGLGTSDLVLDNHVFSFTRLPSGIGPAQAGTGASLGFGLLLPPIPEPASGSLALAATLCALGIVPRHRA